MEILFFIFSNGIVRQQVAKTIRTSNEAKIAITPVKLTTVRKILHRAELQFTCCSAGDADPATLQIKRACNELEPTDTFPLKLYAEIVSNVILYRDTHIEIKLRNGQIL